MNVTNENPKPEHQIRRPGWRTTEFWMATVAMVPVVLPPILSMFEQYAARLPQSSPYAPLAAAGIAIGYAIARALVKKSRNDASAAAMPETINAGGDVNIKPDGAGRDGSQTISFELPNPMAQIYGALPDEEGEVGIDADELQAKAVIEQERENARN